MTAAPTPAAPRLPRSLRRLRPTAGAVLLAGAAALVGCRSGGGSLASTEPPTRTAADPLAAAELAAADAWADGGAVRTASLDADIPRTAARPAGVTRVNPLAPPVARAGGWLPGDGSDAPATRVPAVVKLNADAGRVRLAGAETPAAAPRVKRVKTAPPAAPSAGKPAAPSEPIDWAAEMEAFAGRQAAATPAKASTTPARAAATPVVSQKVETRTPGDSRGGALPPPLDRESLPPAPLWGRPAAASADAAAAPKPTTARPPGGGWHSRKTADIDPFAGS